MIYLFFGDNHYAKQARINELISKHPKDTAERLDGESMDVSDLQNLTAQSLFSEARIIVVSQFSLNKKVAQQLTEVINRIPEATDVIFDELSVKKNTTFYKLLAKHGKAEEFKALGDSQVASWATQYATEIGANMDRSAAAYLVQRAGTNQLLLKNEIDKLALHNSNITKQSIELLVEAKPEDNVFDLLELIAKGKAGEAKSMYRELRQSQAEPHYVMSMIGWQLGNMATVVAHKGKTAQQIASDAGISPYVAQKSLATTRNMTIPAVRRILDLATETDLALKKSAAPADELVEQLIDRLSVEITS